MAKVLLITPPYHCGVVESAGTWMPLGFVYLAGSLRSGGHDVEIYDAMSKFDTYDEIHARLEFSRPDVVATGAITATINDCLKVLALAKEIDPNVTTVLGGVHPTFCYEEIFERHAEEVDFIVRGEGELTFAELLECRAQKDDPAKVAGLAFWSDGHVMVTPDRPFVADLDTLPTAWGLIEWRDYTYRPTPGSTLAVVGFARGCVQQCTFCSQQRFWNRSWRSRSPESFVAELKYLNRTFGVDVVMLADEAPSTDCDTWRRMIDLLIQEDLGLEILIETRVTDILRDREILARYRQAGIVHIYVGVESGSQETLDHFKKNIKVEESKQAIDLINSHDIITETSFVLGTPQETIGSIKETIKLAKYYNPDLAFFLALAPWPYADLYEELKPYIEVTDYSDYNLVKPVIKPVSMSREELAGQLLKAFKSFYAGKMAQLPKMSPFKRDYMIAVARLLAHHSYLADEMKNMGGMPAKIHNQLAGLIGETRKPSRS